VAESRIASKLVRSVKTTIEAGSLAAVRRKVRESTKPDRGVKHANVTWRVFFPPRGRNRSTVGSRPVY